jgi:hypothetical protein
MKLVIKKQPRHQEDIASQVALFGLSATTFLLTNPSYLSLSNNSFYCDGNMFSIHCMDSVNIIVRFHHFGHQLPIVTILSLALEYVLVCVIGKFILSSMIKRVQRRVFWKTLTLLWRCIKLTFSVRRRMIGGCFNSSFTCISCYLFSTKTHIFDEEELELLQRCCYYFVKK